MLAINKNYFTLTNFLVLATIIFYLIQINIYQGNLLFGLNMYFILKNLYWQPLSSMFSHGGIAHLLMNMFVLWQFGNLIEKLIGAKSFLILYLLCGVLTSLLSFLYIYYYDYKVNLVGASGAICALLGFIAYFDKTQRAGIVIWIFLISALPLIIGLPIAWYSHFIGLILGFIYAIIYKLFFLKKHY